MDREFKVNNFDILRLFAAFEVVLLHAYPRLELGYPAFFNVISDFPGISMFFIMSGFLISASLERNPDLKSYFKNRTLRIYPALWVCILVTIPVIAIAGGISFLNRQAAPWFIAQLIGVIYTPGFLSNFGFGSYNGSLWTIPIELQFYVVLPCLYFLLSSLLTKEKQKTIAIFGLFLAFAGITYYLKFHYDYDNWDYANTPKILRYTFIPHVYLFFFGVVLQRSKIYRSGFIYGKGLFWLATYLLINYFIPTETNTYIFKLIFLGFTTISLAYTFPTLSHKLLKGNDVSYGVYIYHGLVLGVLVQLQLFGSNSYILVLLAVTLMLAISSWHFVEKPFLRRKGTTPANKQIVISRNIRRQLPMLRTAKQVANTGQKLGEVLLNLRRK